MKNILVAGGAGYIGSHCCKLLKSKGFKPIVIDDLSTGFKKSVKFGPFYEGDIANEDLLDKIFTENKIDAVMHFSAFAYVGESVTNPSKYYLNNTFKTLTLLNSMLKHNVKHIIFSSTCATYGIPTTKTIDENHKQDPINPYGQSKLFVEKIMKDYKRAYDLNYVIFRYFNAAGCDPDSEIGENHNPETHLIPLILDAALDPTKKLTVFGMDYNTPDGTCIRDYIHVNDLAEAHILGLDILKKNKSDIFNLGNGSGFSVLEIIETVRKITGKNISYSIGERREGDPDVLVGSTIKANNVLNWVPKFDNIEAIIKTAWDYHQIKGIQ